MKVVTSPETYTPEANDICVFLAGGITGCDNWQQAVIDELATYSDTEHLVIINPRCVEFPIDDPNAAENQIRWEFNWLEKCDIFSMYFAGGQSVQPICMYELGRNICRMQMRYPREWRNRLVINTASDYIRKADVYCQVSLAAGHIVNTYGATPEVHAHAIHSSCVSLHDARNMEE